MLNLGYTYATILKYTTKEKGKVTMKKYTGLCIYGTSLRDLQHEMQQYYALFQKGILSEKEYLSAIKPLDKAIDTLEMSTLSSYFVLKKV